MSYNKGTPFDSPLARGLSNGETGKTLRCSFIDENLCRDLSTLASPFSFPIHESFLVNSHITETEPIKNSFINISAYVWEFVPQFHFKSELSSSGTLDSVLLNFFQLHRDFLLRYFGTCNLKKLSRYYYVYFSLKYTYILRRLFGKCKEEEETKLKCVFCVSEK